MPALPPFLTLYQQLIAQPTVSALTANEDQPNQPLVAMLAQWFGELGFHTELFPVPGTRNKYNMLARLGQGPGGLLLSGHTDTVPCDEHRWNYDPFKLTEADNRLYGLGSVDMKGFFAFILEALRALDLRKLNKPLYILATADEESTMLGARTFAELGKIQPDCTVIGEPTGLRPVHMHKGYMAHSVVVTGRSGHSSNPGQGLNAIEVMQQVLGALMGVRDELQHHYHDAHFAVPYPTMNFGNIHGGDATNRICPCCELQLDLRPLPGMAPAELVERLQRALAPINQRHPGAVSISELYPDIPGFATAEEAHLVQLAEQLSGHAPEVVDYATEAPFLQQLGGQTIVMGPGSIKQAHQPDEFIDMRLIQPTLNWLSKLIGQVCEYR